MSTKAPEIKQDNMYKLLREGKISEFNKLRAAGQKSDLTGADLRGLDLRGLEAAGLDFSNAYFRQADLRGIDFSQTKLAGASINGCKISGCLFPVELAAEEIELSLVHGTRMRYKK
ncbi:MAG: pentapeptide repeat-containing protein [Gammaproteobacteria bacterium]|nr:pentapeptide repeat-containing protein [Gammaproteobacteria bacterium]